MEPGVFGASNQTDPKFKLMALDDRWNLFGLKWAVEGLIAYERNQRARVAYKPVGLSPVKGPAFLYDLSPIGKR
jgi:hypothetical protein